MLRLVADTHEVVGEALNDGPSFCRLCGREVDGDEDGLLGLGDDKTVGLHASEDNQDSSTRTRREEHAQLSCP